MSAIIERINVAFGGRSAVSETDIGIMEAMIEIGATSTEIRAQFGYSLEAIEAVRLTQRSSPYRILAS
ncbi:MAG: hypothetical protein EON56_02785 [Alphaproteobacteria bacterium]|nr:MAG: hypothetical protein EON56_02785 [Alphaproteobacteria bacterium]